MPNHYLKIFVLQFSGTLRLRYRKKKVRNNQEPNFIKIASFVDLATQTKWRCDFGFSNFIREIRITGHRRTFQSGRLTGGKNRFDGFFSGVAGGFTETAKYTEFRIYTELWHAWMNQFSTTHTSLTWNVKIVISYKGLGYVYNLIDNLWHFTTKGSISRKSRSRVKGLQRSNVKVDLKIFFLKIWNLTSQIYHLTKYNCWTEVASLCFWVHKIFVSYELQKKLILLSSFVLNIYGLRNSLFTTLKNYQKYNFKAITFKLKQNKLWW